MYLYLVYTLSPHLGDTKENYYSFATATTCHLDNLPLCRVPLQDQFNQQQRNNCPCLHQLKTNSQGALSPFQPNTHHITFERSNFFLHFVNCEYNCNTPLTQASTFKRHIFTPRKSICILLTMEKPKETFKITSPAATVAKLCKAKQLS